MASANRTTDHQTIMEWVERRGGQAAHVTGTGKGKDPGILRIDLPGFSGEGKLEPLAWDAWFDAFEANRLAFLYQDEGDSRFSKLVRRRPEDETPESPAYSRGQRRKGKTSKVDLNTATEEELDALWGVGPANARKIIEYREHDGHIGSPDELNAIEGIDSATVENLKKQTALG